MVALNVLESPQTGTLNLPESMDTPDKRVLELPKVGANVLLYGCRVLLSESVGYSHISNDAVRSYSMDNVLRVSLVGTMGLPSLLRRNSANLYSKG